MPQTHVNGQGDFIVVMVADPITGLPLDPRGSGGAVTVADGADVTQGLKADAAVAWYTTAGSVIGKLGLLIAATVDAGSHAYGYTSGQLTTDAWTLLGTTRTKTFTYTAGVLTAESDWV